MTDDKIIKKFFKDEDWVLDFMDEKMTDKDAEYYNANPKELNALVNRVKTMVESKVKNRFI
jgi:hypothetical protein